jgi:hypothetical protein
LLAKGNSMATESSNGSASSVSQAIVQCAWPSLE